MVFMAKRIIDFYIDEYYHVFNRGTDKRVVFKNYSDINYFIDAMFISNKKNPIQNRNNDPKFRKKLKEEAKQEEKLVSIIAYCLLPNHFHFILKQEMENGISKFMQKLGTSYAKFFNKKYKRSGSLFQGKFKSKLLSGDFSLPLTSVYVNLNYKHHQINPEKRIVKSSVGEYLKKETRELVCNQEEIKSVLDDVGGREEYKKYLQKQSEYFTERKGHNIENLNFKELEK